MNLDSLNWVGWILCILPALVYPIMYIGYRTVLGQKRRQVEIVFNSNSVKQTIIGLKSGINYKDFVFRYTSWEIFIIPIILCVILTFVVCLYFFSSVNLVQIFEFKSNKTQSVFAGFAGAYLWSLYDLLRRYNQIDFTSGTFYNVLISLLLGVIIGYVFSLVMVHPGDVFVAFSIGAFPLEIVRSYLISEGSKRLNHVTISDNVKADTESLCFLQGATKDVILRLKEEGVTSAQHLAFSNPLKVFFRTNLDLAVILDLIDQSILYIYIEERIIKARSTGIRSATAIGEIFDLLYSSEKESVDRGNQLVRELSRNLDVSEVFIRELVDVIGSDEQVHLIGDLLYEAQLN